MTSDVKRVPDDISAVIPRLFCRDPLEETTEEQRLERLARQNAGGGDGLDSVVRYKLSGSD